MKKKLLLALICLLTCVGVSYADNVKTHFLSNPSFDNDLRGWTRNMGHQSSNYANEECTIDHFAESWTWATWNGLGETYINQTHVLPKGTYRLECDAIATNQDDGALTIYGVYLYAAIDGDSTKVNVSTANEAPQHYSIEFTTDGTKEVTMGFGSPVQTNANWVAVDNFALTLLNAKSYSPIDEISVEGNASVRVVNDETHPWVSYGDGKIYASIYEYNTNSELSFDLECNEASSFTMDYLMPSSSYWNSMAIALDGYTEVSRRMEWSGGLSGTVSYILPSGTHHLTMTYHHEGDETVRYFLSNIKLSGLSGKIQEVTLGQAGDLGLEVLSIANTLTDVKYLKINGPLNSSDWATLGSMTSLEYLDMSGAEVSQIPENAFNRNTVLANFICPASLKSIGNSAFSSTALRGVTFNDGLESIGNNAFYGRKISEIQLPGTLKSIGGSAFRETLIKTLVLPESVESLGTYAFYNCDQLETVQLNSTLTTLPNYCFADCDKLKSVAGGENVDVVGNQTFYSCDVLESVADLHPVTIDQYGFCYCYALKSFDFSRTQSIGYHGFAYCDSFTSVNLPAITSMGNYAFYSCDNLKEVIIGASLPTFSYEAFAHCPVTDVYLCQPSAPNRNSNDNLFYFNGTLYETITLHVPEYAMTSYKLHEYWSQFANFEVNPIEVDDITITGQLTLTSNARIPGAPNLTLNYVNNNTSSMVINGSAQQELGNYIQYNSFGTSNNASLISRCDNMSSLSAEVRYKMDYNYYNNWYYLCLPYDVKVSDITTTEDASIAICRYDGSQRATNGAGSSWVRMGEDETLKAGQGYIYCVSQNTVVSLPAVIGTQNQIFSAKAIATSLDENASEVASDGGWNLVGNSYPCYYDIYYMDYTAPITVWNTGNRTFTAYSVADDQLALMPFQAFFVQKPSGVDNLILNPQGRQVNSVISAKEAGVRAEGLNKNQRRVLDLTLGNGLTEDRTRIVINPMASDDFEAETDASKMMSYEAPQIFTQRGEEIYAINEGAQAEGLVDLNLWIPEDGTYTIQASRQDFQFTLTDNGQEVELPYTFSAGQGSVEGRFCISIAAGSDVDAIAAPGDLQNESKVYDLQGRRVSGAVKGIYINNNKKVVK